MLPQLIIHGVLAALLLVGGWMIPAQYRSLHERVLEAAGNAPADVNATNLAGQGKINTAQTLPEFLATLKSDANATGRQFELAEIVRIGDSKVNLSTDTKAENLTSNNVIPALDLLASDAKFLEFAQNAQSSPVTQKIFALSKYAPGYESTVLVVANLAADGKLPPVISHGLGDLNPANQALSDQNGTDPKKSNLYMQRLRYRLHPFFLLAARLSYHQLGELVYQMQDFKALNDIATIARHQTALPAFQFFNTDQKKSPNGLSPDELTGLTPIGEPELFKRFDTNSTGDSKGTLTLDEWRAIGYIPLEYTDFPTTYTACIWSGNPRAVANYLKLHGRRGDEYLRTALSKNRGALELVLDCQLQVSGLATPTLDSMAAFCYKNRQWALFLKYLLMAVGCIMLMRTWNSAFAIVAKDALTVRNLRVRRHAIAATVFLTLIAVSEPILFTPALSSEYQVPINIPVAASDPSNNNPTETNMLAASSNLLSIIFIGIFAAIQVFVYLLCVSKINDIKNGDGDPRLKLRLLENEDNLFDMGLYIGIAGTALMLAIMVMIKNSGLTVSVAYASNIFGILCVAVVKIFHVRQAREGLLLEAENGKSDTLTETEN